MPSLRNSSVITSSFMVLCLSSTIMCYTNAEKFPTKSLTRTRWSTHGHEKDESSYNTNISISSLKKMRNIFIQQDDDDRHGQDPEEENAVNATSMPTKSSSTKPSREVSQAPSYLPTSQLYRTSNKPTQIIGENASPKPTISPSKIDSISPSTSIKPSREATDAPSYLPSFHMNRKSNVPTEILGTISPDDQPAPSNSPQIHPSIIPSTEFSEMASSNPTERRFFTAPSGVPTLNMIRSSPPIIANRLTSAPSFQYDDQSSLLPTDDKPTLGSQPSVRPSTLLKPPTNAPKLSCENIASTGFFGNISLGSMEILSYNYNVEIDPVSDDLLEEEVIPRLESKMLNFLVTNIYFRDDCPNGRRLRTVDKDLINLIGLSSSPGDKLSRVKGNT